MNGAMGGSVKLYNFNPITTRGYGGSLLMKNWDPTIGAAGRIYFTGGPWPHKFYSAPQSSANTVNISVIKKANHVDKYPGSG